MKNFLKKSGWTDILASIALAFIGIFMITNTNCAVKIISYIIGGIFIFIGIIRIVDYSLSKGSHNYYKDDLVYGIIAIIIGIITITCSSLIEYIFRVMIAVWIIYSGLLRLSMSFKLHELELNIWSVSLILAIIMIIGGIYMLLQGGAIVLTLGIIILAYAIMDLIENIIFMKYINEIL